MPTLILTVLLFVLWMGLSFNSLVNPAVKTVLPVLNGFALNLYLSPNPLNVSVLVKILVLILLMVNAFTLIPIRIFGFTPVSPEILFIGIIFTSTESTSKEPLTFLKNPVL